MHIVCRNEARGNEARNELVETTKNSSVFLHIVDLSLMHSVSEFAKKFAESGERLNVLVNNAGVLLEKKEVSEQNFALLFAFISTNLSLSDDFRRSRRHRCYEPLQWLFVDRATTSRLRGKRAFSLDNKEFG